ncbi:MAG TPA: hypothetical protein DDW34_12260 [Clostridium sp.]|nr:hypothetical protein [Clostridium sp.]
MSTVLSNQKNSKLHLHVNNKQLGSLSEI